MSWLLQASPDHRLPQVRPGVDVASLADDFRVVARYIVVKRMEKAFEAGYDPALDLSNASHERRRHRHAGEEEDCDDGHIVRSEQAQIDAILSGKAVGSYYLLMGSKGTGKGTMILDAMRKVNADGSALVEGAPHASRLTSLCL